MAACVGLWLAAEEVPQGHTVQGPECEKAAL